MLILILLCRLRSHVSDEVGLETVKPTLTAFDSLHPPSLSQINRRLDALVSNQT